MQSFALTSHGIFFGCKMNGLTRHLVLCFFCDSVTLIGGSCSIENSLGDLSAFTHDLAVIGGGSGGISTAKEAAKAGARVILFDYVQPTPTGTKWGFGGTCVNVGCIPKKIFHYSSLLGESVHDMKRTGWSGLFTQKPSGHDWADVVSRVSDQTRKLSFSYRMGARKAGVELVNAFAKFKNQGDENTLEYSLAGENKIVRAKHVVVAVGGRPTLPSIPGIEHAITSDDIFHLKKAPGRTLVVGGGYIALEVAGFLTGMGYPTTVASRSKRVLRSFDEQMAEKVVKIMDESGTDFKFGVSVKLLRKRSKTGAITAVFVDGSKGVYDTVFMAVGRTPATAALGLPATVVFSPSGKLVTDETFLVKGTKTIYAVGDCLSGYPELAPVAIKGGELLARRLFLSDSKVLDTRFIPTTVFTPAEYGSVGLSEEQAASEYGAGNIESYLYEWSSLERQAIHRPKNFKRQKKNAQYEEEEGPNCMCKVIVEKSSNKILGFHFIGPNAGEIIQGFALSLKLGATKHDLDDLIGVHPTDAEAFTYLSTTKSSGKSFSDQSGCAGGKCG